MSGRQWLGIGWAPWGSMVGIDRLNVPGALEGGGGGASPPSDASLVEAQGGGGQLQSVLM